MTKARDIADFKFEDIVDTGTEGTKVASGTTAQRGSTAGQLRFNTDTGLAEYYTGTEFKTIDTPPTITSVDVTNVETDLGGTETFVITGSLFDSSATVKFRDNGGTLITPDTTTVNSSSQITVTKTRSSFSNANEPYDIIVTNPSGLEATLDNQINVDNSPVWSTASGTLATINDIDTGTHATVSATDTDGDTIVYSETTSVLSGAGLSLNSSTGAISGDPTDVGASTTNTFTLRATANSKTADRSFNIVVNPTLNGSTALKASRSCKKILDDGFSTGDGLYYVTNHGSISAKQQYCLMDTSYNGGGWTLLYSMNDGNSFASGSNYSFSVDVNPNSPSPTGVYGEDRRNTFIPAGNDQFLIKRSDNNDWRRFVVATWSPTANSVANGWETTRDINGTDFGHPHWAQGQMYDTSGNAVSNYIYFNGCALGGNCATGGGDGSGFSTVSSNSNIPDTFGGAYNNATNGGSPLFWGSSTQLSSSIYVSMWYRKNGTQ